MSLSIDDIWDAPVESTPVSRKEALISQSNTPLRPSPAKRRKVALFLSSDSENDAPQVPYKKRTPSPQSKQKSVLDALFDDLDDDAAGTGTKELAPSLNIDQLRKQAEGRQNHRMPALTPHQVLPSSSPPRDLGPDEEAEDGGDAQGGRRKKGEKGSGLHKRKALPKLDETRLLGKDGFPALVKQIKDFTPKGKGHELSDLNRVLGIYQFWTHRMFPKRTFHDNVQTVEKLCHTRRMHNALGMLRDEAKGTINGRKPEDLEPLGDASDDSSSDSEKEPEGGGSVPSTPRALPTTRSSSPPTGPPSSASERPSQPVDEDYVDIDAMIAEDQERQTATAATAANVSSSSAPPRPPSSPDEDQEMWDQFDDIGGFEMAFEEMAQQQPSAPMPMAVDAGDDDDAWDALREMESSKPGPAKPAAAPNLAQAPAPAAAQAPPVGHQGPNPTNDEGWDEMYL